MLRTMDESLRKGAGRVAVRQGGSESWRADSYPILAVTGDLPSFRTAESSSCLEKTTLSVLV